MLRVDALEAEAEKSTAVATLLDLRATFPAAAAYLSKSHWTRGCLAITLDTLRNKNDPRGFELWWHELDTPFQGQYFKNGSFYFKLKEIITFIM